MTEIKSDIQNHFPFKKETKRLMEKRWVTALTNPYKDSSHHQNSIIELTYHEILKSAKSLYSQLQATSKRTVYEKDCKNNNSESSLAMHSFLTSSCYLHLECSFDYLYRIRYDFYNCPFEKEIIQLINLREHYTPGSFKHWETKPNCKEFFERVIQVQDAQFIKVLPHIEINS
jgi:hypothetical protein